MVLSSRRASVELSPRLAHTPGISLRTGEDDNCSPAAPLGRALVLRSFGIDILEIPPFG
jgi:hypothetical protein